MWRDSDIVGDSLNLMIMIVFILINTISTYDVSIYIFLEGVFFFFYEKYVDFINNKNITKHLE